MWSYLLNGMLTNKKNFDSLNKLKFFFLDPVPNEQLHIPRVNIIVQQNEVLVLSESTSVKYAQNKVDLSNVSRSIECF